MDIETIFSIGNTLVLPFWLLMIFMPYWSWTQRIIGSPWVAAPWAVLYLILIVPQFVGLIGVLTNPSAVGVGAAMATPEAATVAWFHFLAFDLFVGRWIFLDNQENKISAWILGPILFITLMAGPIGYLAYLIAKSVQQAQRS